MRRGVVERGVVTGLIILMIASFSIGIVRADNGTLDGDILTLEGNFPKNNTYQLVYIDIPSVAPFNYANFTGNLIVPNISSYPALRTLKSKKNFTVNVTNLSNNFTTEFKVVNINPESTPLYKQQPTATQVPTAVDANATDNGTTDTDTPDKKEDIGLLEQLSEQKGIIIVILLVIILITLIQLGYINIRLKKDKEPRRLSQVPEQTIETNYKLILDLNDGTARIPDRIIEITNKNGILIANIKSDINGSCTFELPKDTYIVNIKGGENYEDYSKKVRLSDDKRDSITLVKKQHLQIEVVDESGKPIKGIYARVRESGSGVDAPGNPETDANGIARFTLSRNKKYTASINALTQDYGIPGSMEITSSDTSRKFILKRKEGMLEITVTEQAKGQIFAGIPVIVMKKGAAQPLQFFSDNNGKIKQKVPVGDYTIQIKPGASQLYEASEKQVNVSENRLVPVTLDLRFSYKPGDQTITEINKHYEKLNNSFKEVSAYDRCIPLFFKSAGERPLKLIERIIKRPLEFLDSRTTPDEIINYILSAEEIISEEISRIMREKSNVDFYFSIQNLPQVEELAVSDYSQEKFNELVQDLSNYHKNHFREIGNKLHDIDTEITDLSRSLTIQPVADLWRTAQKLQENCNNEPDAKKKGVMLFINDKLLDHVREMYTRDEVKERLKVSML